MPRRASFAKARERGSAASPALASVASFTANSDTSPGHEALAPPTQAAPRWVPELPALEQRSTYVMVFNEALQKWVPSQRKAPRPGRAAAIESGDPAAVEAARTEELENRPRWGGTIKPTKPLKPVERVPRIRHFNDAGTATATASQCGSSIATASRHTSATTHRSQAGAGAVSLPPIRGATDAAASPSATGGARTARVVKASSPPGDVASPASTTTARRRVVGIAADESNDRPEHRRALFANLQKRSSLPGHHPLQLSDRVPVSEEIVAFNKDVEAFERKVPYGGNDNDDDEEPGGLSTRVSRGRIAVAAAVAAAAFTAGPSGATHGEGGPNVLCGILVRVPLPEIWAAYCVTETAHMRKFGMALRDFTRLVRGLVPEFDASDAIVARGFDLYEPSVRSPESHVTIVQFLAQFGREMSTAAAESDFMFFFDVASGAAAQRRQAQQKMSASGRRGSQGKGPQQQQQQQPQPPPSSVRTGSPPQSKGASRNRRGSIARLSQPAPAPASQAVVPGAPIATTGAAPSPAPVATLSASLLVGANLRTFIKENVRSGVARANWGKLAAALDAERAHVLSMLRYLGIDTAAFEPAPVRTEIERKVLGAPEPPPFPRLSLVQWRFLAYTNAAIHRAIDGMWFPLAAAAA